VSLFYSIATSPVYTCNPDEFSGIDGLKVVSVSVPDTAEAHRPDLCNRAHHYVPAACARGPAVPVAHTPNASTASPVSASVNRVA